MQSSQEHFSTIVYAKFGGGGGGGANRVYYGELENREGWYTNSPRETREFDCFLFVSYHCKFFRLLYIQLYTYKNTSRRYLCNLH